MLEYTATLIRHKMHALRVLCRQSKLPALSHSRRLQTRQDGV